MTLSSVLKDTITCYIFINKHGWVGGMRRGINISPENVVNMSTIVHFSAPKLC